MDILDILMRIAVYVLGFTAIVSMAFIPDRSSQDMIPEKSRTIGGGGNITLELFER